MSKISIIIPVYNTEKYLPKCLDSVINQSYRDIEIIVVDDCSPGNCEEIVKEYQEKDKRIVYIRHEENKGLFMARKTGVKRASGEYILHLDSDDWLGLDVCEKIEQTIKKEPVDIIQMNIQSIFQDKKRFSNLFFEKLEGKRCFEELFVNNTFTSWGLMSKVMKKELLEKAYQEIPDNVYLVNSEDFVLNYIAVFLANSFIGCKKAIYYYNRVDVSPAGSKVITKEAQERWLLSIKSIKEIIETFKEKYEIEKLYPVIQNEEYHNYWIATLFLKKTPKNKQKELFSTFCESIGLENIFDIFSKYYPLELLANLLPSYQKKEFKTVKTIALLDNQIYYGGMGRVITLLSKIFDDLGYNVIMITEEENENDYDMPKSVIREIIGTDRYKSLADIIQKHQIDVVALNNHSSEQTLYDLAYLKFRGDITIINSIHSTSSWFYYENMPQMELFYRKYYDLADVMTVLSNNDHVYVVNNQQVPAIYMPNPLTFNPKEIEQNNLEEINVVAIGRISPEKNIIFLIESFQKVLEKIPQAKLYIVGDGPEQIPVKQYIKQLGITDSVEMVEYTTEADKYYKLASIHVLSSTYEGMPMTWLEAKSYGIPSVVSRMDYVELSHYKGAVIVDQEDVVGFSQAIIKLLDDKYYRKEMGREARESLEYFTIEKTTEKWKRVFREISSNNLYESDLIQIDPTINQGEILVRNRDLKLSLLSTGYQAQDIMETPFITRQKLKVMIKPLFKKSLKKIVAIITPKGSNNRYILKKIVKKWILKIQNLYQQAKKW